MERTGFSAPTVPSTERTVTTSGPSEYQEPPEKKAIVAVACAANGSTERIAVAAANAAPRPMETQFEARSQRSSGSVVSVRLLAARTLLRRKQAAAKVDQTAAKLDVEAAEIELEIAKAKSGASDEDSGEPNQGPHPWNEQSPEPVNVKMKRYLQAAAASSGNYELPVATGAPASAGPQGIIFNGQFLTPHLPGPAFVAQMQDEEMEAAPTINILNVGCNIQEQANQNQNIQNETTFMIAQAQQEVHITNHLAQQHVQNVVNQADTYVAAHCAHADIQVSQAAAQTQNAEGHYMLLASEKAAGSVAKG